jgi:hypothetical protein
MRSEKKRAVRKMLNSVWMKIILNLLPVLVKAVTPELREHLVIFVGELEKKAKQTNSPIDDILVGILKQLLIIE